ncbi:hypothetical protein FSP39_017394 [Pinctada imbricata]|uniref:CCHC-type domain-containing protein n=1 Tax=Pinctada imbricata TaxID=66713 RepID=A0AA88XG39_PINIB|nr:hypothetical protein FSP39_017394 [Pinctada imbricata]
MADDEHMENALRTEVHEAVAASQNSIMSEIRSLISTEMHKFGEKQKEIADAQISKIESTMTDSYKFKRRGNEEQYKHNQKVLNKLTETETLIQSEFEPQNLEKAKSTIAEGIDLVKHRQKLVKLADSSELGWKVVLEYESNPLADDSDDEKRMVKAQNRAERKHKADRNKRLNRTHPYSTQGPRTQTDQRTNRPGRCFSCGEKGHWKKDCPAERSNDQTKLSTNFYKAYIAQRSESSSTQVNPTKVDQSQSGVTTTVGRLRSCLSEWKLIDSNDHVLSVIENGYKLPFKTFPESVRLDNNKSARDNPNFVSKEIVSLLEKGSISKVKDQPEVINPLTVAYNRSGKPRLVLDCRHVNPHLFQFKFKYEDSSVARSMFSKGDFVFSFDLKTAYHHVMIHPEDKTFLGFSWQGFYYVFNVLPFGLATAGFIFSKIMREVVKHWRSRNINIIMYLDDGLAGAATYDEAKKVSTELRNDLLKLGFIIAEDKCDWTPSQYIVWLGFEWDTKTGMLRLTKARVDKIIECIKDLFSSLRKSSLNLVKVKQLAGIVGRLISSQAVIGNEVRLRTRYAYECILSRASWTAPVIVTDDAQSELKFWLKNIESLNKIGCSFHVENDIEVCDAKVYCDASGVGYGGYVTSDLCEFPDEEHMYGSWDLSEQKESSTWREIESVNRVLKHSLPIIENKCTEVYTDNKNVETILNVGSRKPHIHKVSMEINNVCREHNIRLKPIWIPRSENSKADKLSRLNDCDDWGVQTWVFDKFDNLWGINLRQNVQQQIEHSGVLPGSELHSLSSKMSEYLLASKSDNTVKSYYNSFKRWRSFITSKGHSALPAMPIHVALYVTHLLNTGATQSVVNSAIYSIKWAHSVNNLTDPTDNGFVSALQNTAKRLPRQPKRRKDPVTSDMLVKLCNLYIDNNDLLIIRDLTMILLCFAGFLRFDEVSSLLCKHVSIFDDYLSLKIVKSKTDQYRDGQEILISKGTTSACPLEMFKRYIKVAGISLDSDFYLFRPVFRSGSVCKLIHKNKKMSYTAARESIISCLKLVSENLNLGLHSMRSGGATAAAASSLVNERCWKRHGRWKSDSSKDGYVVDTLDKRLEVSKSLGL